MRRGYYLQLTKIEKPYFHKFVRLKGPEVGLKDDGAGIGIIILVELKYPGCGIGGLVPAGTPGIHPAIKFHIAMWLSIGIIGYGWDKWHLRVVAPTHRKQANKNQ